MSNPTSVQPAQTKAIAILARLAQEMQVLLDTSDLYLKLVTLLREEAGYQNCALFITNGDGHLAQVAAVGYRSNEKKRRYPVPFTCLAAGKVGDDAFLINNVETVPTAKQGSSLGRGSLLVMLLKPAHLLREPAQNGTGDKVIGALQLEDEREDAFNNEDCQLLQALSTHFAKAIEFARHYQQVREMALYDELTGLYHRRFFREYLERELERAARTGQPISLAIIDVDKLNRINDVYGHLVGDSVLKIIAQVLAKGVRAYDVLARYGGDEFVLVMPDTIRARAEQVMSRLVGTGDKARLKYLSQNIFVPSFSYGVATFPQDGKTYEEIFAVGDKRLYEAKGKKGIYTGASDKDEKQG